MYIAATAMLAYLAMCNTSSEVDTTQFEVILTTIASANAVIWFTVNVALIHIMWDVSTIVETILRQSF